MNAKQIADRLVAKGIGEYLVLTLDGIDVTFYKVPGTSRVVKEREFISDWRTAGACLELCVKAWPKKIINTKTLKNPAAICAEFAEVE